MLSLALGSEGFEFLLLLVAIRLAVGLLPVPRGNRLIDHHWRLGRAVQTILGRDGPPADSSTVTR